MHTGFNRNPHPLNPNHTVLCTIKFFSKFSPCSISEHQKYGLFQKHLHNHTQHSYPNMTKHYLISAIFTTYPFFKCWRIASRTPSILINSDAALPSGPCIQNIVLVIQHRKEWTELFKSFSVSRVPYASHMAKKKKKSWKNLCCSQWKTIAYVKIKDKLVR